MDDYAARARRWCDRIVSGKEPAGDHVIAAAKRDIADRERWTKRSDLYWFDDSAANNVCRFVEYMPHIKGRWARNKELIRLEDWQCFHLATFFGWKRADGGRRYRESYEEVARKNAKSTKAAPVGLWLLGPDCEPGAEVYSAATTRDQARIIFGVARAMANRLPDYRAEFDIDIGTHSIHRLAEESWFRAVSSEAHSLEGLNVHGGLIDEVHVHRTNEVIDVLRTAMGSRDQPVLWQTTTAGVWDVESVYVREHNYLRQILDGSLTDDQAFGFIAAGDKDEDWEDPTNLRKANPNLDVSVRLDYLQSLARKAQTDKSFTNEFLRKHLNIPTSQVDRWIEMSMWDDNAGAVDEAELIGAPCYGGLDLSTTTDFTAWVLVFPQPDGGITILPRLFLPEDTAGKRAKQDRAPYEQWADDGHLLTTEGNAVDYDMIERQIVADCARFRVRKIGFDPWNAEMMAQRLMSKRLPVQKMIQGYGTFNEAMKELERMLRLKEVRHGGHPVLRWMANNVAVRTNIDGFSKPDKPNSTSRIDGIVALLMAVAQLVSSDRHSSRYESEGLLIV